MKSGATTLTWRRGLVAALGAVLAAALALTGQSAKATHPQEEGAMSAAFAQAAEEYDIPRVLLAAVGYSETHLDGHGGEPSYANGYGVMHLVSNPERHVLERASRITGVSAAELRNNTAANIRGGAAILRAHADGLGLDAQDRDRTSAWYPAVARYGGTSSDQTARLYADAVYDVLSDGVCARTGDGLVRVAPGEVTPDRGRYAEVSAEPSAQSPDYPPAQWVPASSANYSGGRSSAITAVVIHVTQGSYAGTISWFQSPSANVSAHYVVRSSDGDVTQMVRDRDTAWHARSGNAYSVGIEHEGFVDDPSWFTDAMYRSSAALTKHLCDEYGIPKDRAHIVGHSEVPGNDHTDPGPHWDWDYYLQLVNG